MKLKNNNGSALMTVIILFCVLITLVTVTMTFMSANHRKRVKESRRLENLYESEAGLDVAYNIIVKTFEAGINAGTERVKNIKEEEFNKLSESEKRQKKDEEFKLGFKAEVGIDSEDNEFKKSIDGRKYIKNYKSSKEEERYKTLKFNLTNSQKEPTINAKSVIYKNDEYVIKVGSEFEMKDATGNNKRKIDVTYEVDIPNYQDVDITVSDKSVEIPDGLKGKVIAIDGDMDINGNSNVFDINGDVFVKGNDNNIKNLVYDKYKGGIKVTGVSNMINFNGNIVTPKTFNIEGDNININQRYPDKFNLYAGNTYIGKTDGNYTSSSLLNINNAILDNDLAMKSNSSIVNINKFYGINDKTYTSNRDGIKESRTSSSIIVNGNNSSALKINDEAYIMGTAYINAQNENNESYQTGESVAIKGNYLAYTYPMGDIGKLGFENHGLLQLIDSVNGQDLSAIQKSDYFNDFVESNQKNNLGANISHGGVELPQKTYSIGAIVKNVNNNLVVERSNYNKAMDDAVNIKREEYAKQVYCIGDGNGKDLNKIYNKLGAYQENIASKINLDGKDYKSPSNEEFNLIINSDKNKTIKLGKDITPINNKIKALVITNGNVEIEGNFEFEGAIISTKDVKIYNKKQNINYNEETIKNILSLYSDKLKDVFINENIDTYSDEIVKEDEVQSYIYQYDTKKYIKRKLWKIVK